MKLRDWRNHTEPCPFLQPFLSVHCCLKSGIGGAEAKRLNIVEFELEQDIFNPLYPTASHSTTSDTSSSGTSATTASRSGFSTNASESSGTMRQTSAQSLVSTSSDENTPQVDIVSQASTQLSTLNMGCEIVAGRFTALRAWFVCSFMMYM